MKSRQTLRLLPLLLFGLSLLSSSDIGIARTASEDLALPRRTASGPVRPDVDTEAGLQPLASRGDKPSAGSATYAAVSPQAPGDGIFGPAYLVPGVDRFYPMYLTAGDVNADSRPDLVASGSWITPLGAATPRVLVLLGNGDGTFAMPQGLIIVGDEAPTQIADLDGDGNLDLVAPCQLGTITDRGVCRVLGTGDGTFSSFAGFPSGFSQYVAVGDFNRDGANDLATSNSNDEVAVQFNLGNGTFSAPTAYLAGDLPMGIVAADFNEDTWPDLAVAMRTDSQIFIYSNQGDGTFQSPAILQAEAARAHPLVAGDFNQDGHADLVVGGDSARSVNLFLGLGDGGFLDFFGSATSTNGVSIDLATGDFNGDGVADLVSAENFDQTLALLLGVGNGRFAPRSNVPVGMGTEYYPLSVAVGDFNADGWEDVVAASDWLGSIQVFLNQHPFPGVCNDADSDGFGVPGDPTCPGGAVVDCNDGNPGIFPGAPEICDGVDNDCDLLDGFNDDLDAVTTCAGDCDDHNGSTRPGAREYCDGVDQDCDGTADVPGENGMQMAIAADQVSISWAASAGYQVTYNLYRGGIGSGGSFYNQTCFAPSLPGPSASDGQVPGLGSGYYYLVSGRNSCGEGTLGPNWLGASRPNALPCP